MKHPRAGSVPAPSRRLSTRPFPLPPGIESRVYLFIYFGLILFAFSLARLWRRRIHCHLRALIVIFICESSLVIQNSGSYSRSAVRGRARASGLVLSSARPEGAHPCTSEGGKCRPTPGNLKTDGTDGCLPCRELLVEARSICWRQEARRWAGA